MTKTKITNQIAEPNSARLFAGYLRNGLSDSQWREDLKLFTGFTGLLVQPLGLKSYITCDLPSVLPDGRSLPDFLPGRLARVGYSSQAQYRDLAQTDGRKYYGPSHRFVFDMERSFSAFATFFNGKVDEKMPLHLMQNGLDWQKGSTLVYLGMRPENTPAEQFLTRLSRVFSQAQLLYRLSQGYGVDAIDSIQTRDFVAIFEHRAPAARCNWSISDLLSEVSVPIVNSIAKARTLPTALAAKTEDIDISKDGAAYDFRFPRV